MRGSRTSARAARSSSATAPTRTSRCIPRARHHADVTEGSGGTWERLDYDWSDPHPGRRQDHRPKRGAGPRPHLHVHAAAPTGRPRSTYVVVREGKNLKGTVPRCSSSGASGRASSRKAFGNTVKGASRPATPTGAPDRPDRAPTPRHEHARLGDSRPCRERARHRGDGRAPLYRRYRHDGGDEGLPGLGVLRGTRELGQRPAPRWSPRGCSRPSTAATLPRRHARFLNNATHWGFGLARGRGVRALPRVPANAEALVRAPVRRRGLGRRIRRPPLNSASTSRSGSTTSIRSQGPQRARRPSGSPPRPRILLLSRKESP